MRHDTVGPITRSHLARLTPEQLRYRRRKAADPHAPEDGRCRFGVGPTDPPACRGEALYEWHATRSDAAGRPGTEPGVDWHFELTEALCEAHAAERTGRSASGGGSKTPSPSETAVRETQP